MIIPVISTIVSWRFKNVINFNYKLHAGFPNYLANYNLVEHRSANNILATYNVQRWIYANSLVYLCVIKVNVLNDWSLQEVTQLRVFHLSPLRCDRTMDRTIKLQI